jgi:hypothetical protein
MADGSRGKRKVETKIENRGGIAHVDADDCAPLNQHPMRIARHRDEKYKPNMLHISIDVNQTILNDDGHLIIGVHEALAQMHANGDYELQLWSKGGAEYAREIADKFELSQFFKSFGSKPDVAIADLPEDAAPTCRLGVPFADAAKSIDGFVAEAVETTLHPSRNAIELVADIQAEQVEIEQKYRETILRDGIPLHPVPFFGNLDCAAIVTIGLNPSSTEFEPWRSWPNEAMTPDDLARRLAGYFRSVNPRPHSWFGEYQEALGIIGGDYKINAVYLDLTPWPTLSPTYLSKRPRPERTFRLRQYNIALKTGSRRWLARLIGCCSHKVKLILVFDTFGDRATKTKVLCRNALPNNWTGRIENFKDTRKAQIWCWNNCDELRQLLGGNVFIG